MTNAIEMSAMWRAAGIDDFADRWGAAYEEIAAAKADAAAKRQARISAIVLDGMTKRDPEFSVRLDLRR